MRMGGGDLGTVALYWPLDLILRDGFNKAGYSVPLLQCLTIMLVCGTARCTL